MVCKSDQKHLCIPCLAERGYSTREVQCILKVSRCSLKHHGHSKELSQDTTAEVSSVGTLASRLDQKTCSPRVKTQKPPRDNAGKNNKETTLCRERWKHPRHLFLYDHWSLRGRQGNRGIPLHMQASRTNPALWTDDAEISKEKDTIRTTQGLC